MLAEISDVLEGRRRWVVVCASNSDILQAIPDGAFGALVTDPPYGIGEARGKNASRGNLAKARDYGVSDWDDSPPTEAEIAACRRVARWSVLFGGNYFVLPPSSCWLVWDKLNGANDFADCELAWTNLPKAVRRLAYRWNGMIRENNEERGAHPTQKPVGVMLWTLKQLPSDVQTVMDPFCGSGTTGVACLRMGLRFVGIEREPQFAEVARERLAAEEKGLSLNDARSGQKSIFEVLG